jgi:hypothetical protein
MILSEARKTDPEDINSIRFDAASDRFEVITRSRFSAKRESGLISAIRYFLITSSQELLA